MLRKIKAIIDDNLPLISNLANVTAILKDMENINWCGFYIAKDDVLYLGPFQGDVACATIPFGKGVCGTSALKKETIVVDNVLEFPGHIACSEASKSEIVVPIIVDEKVKAVIDIDSPIFNRFTNKDKKDIEEIVSIISILFK